MKKFSYLKTTAHSEIVFLYELTKQKIRQIVDALVKRNQISTWPMWKSDFRMTHEEMIFKLLLFDKFLDEPAIFLMKFCDAQPIFYNFFSKLVKLKHKID